MVALDDGATPGEGDAAAEEGSAAEADGGATTLAAGSLDLTGVGVALPLHPPMAMATTAMRPIRFTASLPDRSYGSIVVARRASASRTRPDEPMQNGPHRGDAEGHDRSHLPEARVDAVIRTEQLTKHYGKARGIIGIDLEVRPGEIFGFLGPNGAGKSTTTRLLLDLIRPTSGRAAVLGLDAHRDRLAIARRVSYLPGELTLYGDLTGAQTLEYLGNLRGRPDRAYRSELVDRLELDPSKKVKSLSRGNKQKVGLVAAFQDHPELLILDEPTSGLDPFVQLEFERLADAARRDGRTVFVSSHILPEVEHLCDRVGIIREGRLVTVESIAKLKERALQRLEIDFTGPVPADAFAGLPGVRDLTVTGGTLRCTVFGSVDSLVKTAARFEVHTVRSIETSLEEIFLAYYGTGDETGDAAA